MNFKQWTQAFLAEASINLKKKKKNVPSVLKCTEKPQTLNTQQSISGSACRMCLGILTQIGKTLLEALTFLILDFASRAVFSV